MAIASRRGEEGEKKVGGRTGGWGRGRGRLEPRGSGELPGARYGSGIKIKGVAFLSRNKMILAAFPRIVGLNTRRRECEYAPLLRILFLSVPLFSFSRSTLSPGFLPGLVCLIPYREFHESVMTTRPVQAGVNNFRNFNTYKLR